MPLEVFPTTAEHLIAATEAVLLKATGCDEDFVSQFIDVPVENARNALRMAVQLGLVEDDPIAGFRPRRPFAVYLVTASDLQKAAILRLVLEDFEPYQTFKARLDVLGLAPAAAEQVKQLFGLGRHREEIKDTLVNLGTFAQSLRSEGAGLFKVAELDTRRADFLQVIAEVVAERAAAEIAVRRRLGSEASAWVSDVEVLSPIITAFQKVPNVTDTRSPVLYAGNAVESFLSQVGVHVGVDLTGAPGINAKVDALGPGHLKTKHRFMLKYLGHIRNAADHGTDAEIGGTWTISPETACEYVHVAISVIRAVVLGIGGRHVV